MELEELKASWNVLNKRLEEGEVANLRLVKELIAQKTRTGFDGIYKHNLYNFVVTVLIAAVMFPWVYMNTPISATSFWIVEGVMILSLIPQAWKFILLSRFDLEGKTCSELSRLMLRYKQVCHKETVWGIAAVCLAMVAFYISELGFNKSADYVLGSRLLLPIGLSLLTIVVGYVFGLWMRKHHAMRLKEIEQGLEELKEFEE